ncbi:MAG: ABC transporter permease [Bacillota bacterium]
MSEIANFLAAAVRMATPLLIAGLGLCIAERAGMINIGGEGIMLIGAFAGYTATRLLGSYWIGALFAMLAGVIMIAVFGFATIRLKAQQVVIGAAMNMLCAGLTSVIYRKLFYNTTEGVTGTLVQSFPAAPIPFLSKIPVLGQMLFSHNVIVYFGFVMMLVLWWVIKKTSLGIKIIATGEHPKAADSLGIRVNLTRWLTTLFSGLMLGLAGAYLSIAQTNSFAESMTGGKGFIALAVVILGKWNPIGILWGALIFGGANALQMSLQNLGLNIPNNIIMMMPYIVTVIAVVTVSKNRVSAPSAQGVPYEKS